jgi:hypothetical protein
VAGSDGEQYSKTSGEVLGPEVYGKSVSLITGGAETRRMARPTKAGQLVSFSYAKYVGNATINFDDVIDPGGTNKSVLMSDAGAFLVVQSFRMSGNLVWRVVASHSTSYAA